MQNKNGWGLNEMLVFCAIIIAFLILTVILINQLYSGLEKNEKQEEKTNYTYKEVEENLKLAAKNYYKKHKDEEIEIVLSEDLLLEKYITEEQLTPTKEQFPCAGYVEIEDVVKYNSYISCDNYETEGY